TDDAGIASYNLFRGGAAAGTSSSTTATFTGLTCGTSHDLAVQAVDFAGNVSGLATLTASTSDCDTTPPTVALTSPPAGTVSGLVSLAATAADDDAVAGVQFRLDGVALGAEDTTAPYSLSWDSRAAVNGAHVLTAVARDPSGNTTASAPVNVTVDNTGTPPPAGLVAAFAFDEGSGSTVEDASGQNNDGTIANATWSALGKFGPALSFDGNGDVVTVADAPSLDATTGLTLEAWVKPSALNTNWRTVLFKEQSGNLVYALYANRNTSVPAFEIHTGGVRTLNGVNQIALGFWTHLAATYDGANQRLYVNGNLVATRAQTGNITTSTGALKIGGNGIFGEWFAGLIDEVRVYNRALTQPEIQGDMASRVVPDTFPPTVAATTPAAGATGVAPDATLTATFGEQMNGTTFTSSTFELRDASNTLVPAAVSYNGGTGAASLDPTGVLAWGATYTARIKGGASGVKDVAGNALASDHTWTFTVEPPPPPILVLGSTTNRFSTYVEEILKAEGLNAYDTLDVALASPWLLPAYEVVVLGDVALTPAQVTMLTDYVTAGGNLIALSPDKQLAGLLGLTDAGSTLANGYLAVNGSAAPGAGIATQTMQFHGTADLYTTSGATTVASLYTDRSTPSPSPAVTLRSVGASGGQAAAFTYDLARSIVLTRQGNPAWVGQNRDGIGPPRPNDLFYGAAAGDPQPDWLDTQRIGIPQADEQQRLLANLIVETSRDRMPLPRFWYLPRGEKAAVVMTGDDHAVGGTEGRFAQYVAASPAGCSVVLWECVRGTSYIYPNNAHLTSSEAEALESQGFELAVHVNTNCATWTPGDLDVKFTTQLTDFADNYPTLDAPRTNRTHCVVWSDWATQATVSLSHGVRLDTNYYHYPEGWIGGLPGYMTGSALPMRFADLDGTPIDVYQAHTHMNDEAAQAYPLHVDYLLDKALGPEGYYGVLTANMHTDEVDSAGSDAIVASALARGVPVITARQLLTWLDGRDGSSFGAFGWSGDVLSFSVSVGSGATGLQAMLPVAAAGKTLSALARGGSPVPYTVETVKGIQYAVFAAAAGSYAATYAP
ncbi:MAG TPA: LamG-like jellyroll fold domain-containing protein, partial [Actinomycetota bacterium]